MEDKLKFDTVDGYIAAFPKEVQKLLEAVRASVKKAAPDAQEVISYNMPAYKLNGILVYFAAWKTHIGLYPGAAGIETFKNELSGYVGAKGSVQFPMNQPLPIDLITKIVTFRVAQNKNKTKPKPKKSNS